MHKRDHHGVAGEPALFVSNEPNLGRYDDGVGRKPLHSPPVGKASEACGSDEPVISVDRLVKNYSSHLWSTKTLAALRGVSLQAFRGEVFGLLGPNGAGKTTLIKILLGVVRPSGGTAKLFDLPAGSILARTRVGYLPESLRIDRHHTARTALQYYGRMSRLSRADIAARIDPLLKLVGLEGRDREPVRRFSKGMYQRLGLAQALLHDPDLLILDEPTDGLDPVGRSEVRRLLLELKNRGKTIFLNSHILQEVEMVCDRVAIMSHGEVRGIGSIDELTHDAGGKEVQMDVEADGVVAGRDDGELSNHIKHRLKHSLDPIFTSQSTHLLALESQRMSPRIDELPGGMWRIKAHCDDQARTDAAIDALRKEGFSIVGLKTNRRTLEDVFLSLVEPSASTELSSPTESQAI